MKLMELKVKNFRNYKDLELKLNPYINIFIGDNGSGKTNILEAIYLLSLTKSCRFGLDSDLIMQGEVNSNIVGKVDFDDYYKSFKIEFDKYSKRAYINNSLIKKISNYVGEFAITSFLPDDIEIIKGAPSIRRNSLNIAISLIYNNYLHYVNEYNSILKIRNEYLKRLNINGEADKKYLDIINSKFINVGLKIYYYRFFYINEVNKLLPTIYKKLSGNSDIKIEYINSYGVTTYNEDELKKIMELKFSKNLYKEMMQGVTLSGVHRDDFVFLINGMDAKVYGSEGQQRLIIIAYKISELLIYKKIKKDYPVLLLDDVFSEIDIKRRNKIIKFLKQEMQVIITTTDLEDIDSDLVKDATIYSVKNGIIKIKGGAKWKKK